MAESPKSDRAPWSALSRRLLWWVGLVGAIALLVIGVAQWQRGPLAQQFDQTVTQWAMTYRQWFRQQDVQALPGLLALSFGGGLVASVSPCILSLLPVNLSYIGTLTVRSRRAALTQATAFVLGVVVMLSLFGLVSALAGLVLIQFAGYFQLAVGLFIVLMGLQLAALIRLPLPRLPQISPTPPRPPGTGPLALLAPFGVGLTFALVSSPCASPILFAVLSAGAATGSQVHSILAMVSFSLGYTALIFLASVFTGLLKQTRRWLQYSQQITRLASLALVVIGGVYLVNGLQWVVASAQLPG